MAGYTKRIPEDRLNEFEKELAKFDEKYALILRFGIETGFRVTDVLSLRVGQLKRKICLCEGKTGKRRETELPKELFFKLAEYAMDNRLKPGDAIFFSSYLRKNKPLSRIRVYQVFKAVARRMGLESVGTHSMRKTYAWRMYEKTGNIRAVQKALGHKYVETTLRYFVDFNSLEIA